MTIGTILGVFLLVVAAFISYMESISYFDAFYACFITYSTIGFGDIDIYVIVETSQTNRAIQSMSFDVLIAHLISVKLVQPDDLW